MNTQEFLIVYFCFFIGLLGFSLWALVKILNIHQAGRVESAKRKRQLAYEEYMRKQAEREAFEEWYNGLTHEERMEYHQQEQLRLLEDQLDEAKKANQTLENIDTYTMWDYYDKKK